MFAVDGILLQVPRWLSFLLRIPCGWVGDVCLGCFVTGLGIGLMTMEEYGNLLFTLIGLSTMYDGLMTAGKPLYYRVRFGRQFLEDLARTATQDNAKKMQLYQQKGYSLSYTLFRLVPVFVVLCFLAADQTTGAIMVLPLALYYYCIAAQYLHKAR